MELRPRLAPPGCGLHGVVASEPGVATGLADPLARNSMALRC